jgi:hypothetical protein
VGIRARLLPTVAAAAALTVTSGCASPRPLLSTACAGQCKSPYELDVTFRPGISRQAATAAVSRCRASRLVIRIELTQWNSVTGQWTAVILTKEMASGAPAAARTALLTCLRQQRSVDSEGWPD